MRNLVTLVLFLTWMVRPAAAAEVTPAALLAEGALPPTFEAATGAQADATWFGVYAIQPVGDVLYLGLGAARPGESDGALLARLDDAGLTALASLPEQGFISMAYAPGRLYIPGADPEEGWELGNVYVHDLATAETVKRRTLVGTIHTLAVWRDPDGRLLAPVGRYLGDGLSWPWAGGIYSSTDEGQSWTLDADAALGTSRTYDVRRGPGGLVAIADDSNIEGCQLATQANGGPWQRQAGRVLCRARLAALADGRRMVAVGADGRSLVDAATGRALPLPFTLAAGAWNWQAVVGRTLYMLADGSRVMASEDLRTWRTVATFAAPVISVAYWPARQALVVATRGSAGGVYAVPVDPDGR